MIIREKFETDLKELQSKLMEQGRLAEMALEKALSSLKGKNIELALEVIDEDSKSDILHEELTDFAIWVIAKQQPVSIDLRRVIVAMKISTEIERIADFAVNIAKSVIRIGEVDYVPYMEDLERMNYTLVEMLRTSLQSYYEEDAKLAKKAATLDDQLDTRYRYVIESMLEASKEGNIDFNCFAQIAFLCRYFERAGDHVTNISEHVLYLVKGMRFDLNE